MIVQKKIDEAVQKLISVYTPLEIYIFGSYAWGKPTEDSDVDFLIVVEKSDLPYHKRPRAGYRELFGIGFPKDILVVTKDEFNKKAGEITSLYYQIKKSGVKKYEAA